MFCIVVDGDEMIYKYKSLKKGEELHMEFDEFKEQLIKIINL